MHVRRASALASLTLAVSVAIVGCSEGEPTPKMPDLTPSSPAASATQSETVEQESPEAFIRRWVEVNTEMQNTGETGAYRDLSKKCRPCKATAERIEEIYAAGGFVRTDGWVIRGVTDRTGTEGGPVLDLTVESSPTEYKESPGAELQSLPGGRLIMRVRLDQAQPWQVIQLTQVAR